MKTKTKFRPDEIVVAHTSFATGNDLVRHGERRRGSDPTVQAYPDAFVPDGTLPSEMPNMWQQVPDPPQHEPEFHRGAEPIPDEETAVCVTAYSVGRTSFGRGVRRRWDDPAVQANRQFWGMAPRPVPEATSRRVAVDARLDIRRRRAADVRLAEVDHI